MTATGFLHPGAMGSTIATTCAGETFWVSPGRSAVSRARSDAAGLVDVETLRALADRDTFGTEWP